jgi:hypothetical protein
MQLTTNDKTPITCGRSVSYLTLLPSIVIMSRKSYAVQCMRKAFLLHETELDQREARKNSMCPFFPTVVFLTLNTHTFFSGPLVGGPSEPTGEIPPAEKECWSHLLQMRTRHTSRGCTGDFPTRNSKKTLGFHIRNKIETKKTSKRSQQNNSRQPQNCLFLISTKATKTHAGVHITQCYYRALPALTT